MNVQQLGLAVLWGAFVPLLVPVRAHACTCAGTLDILGLSDGAVDVPIDIAPLLRGAFDASQVRLQSQAGVAVPIAVRGGGAGTAACSGQIAELTPQEPLAPNTAYVISVAESGGGRSGTRAFHFTTGAAKVPEQPLAPPPLTVTLLHGNPIRDSCLGMHPHGCLHVGAPPPQQTVEVTFLDASDNVLGWTLAAGDVMERAHDATCVEARTRDAAGRRSAPTRRCGEELAKREARTGDFVDYRLQCREGRVIESAGASGDASSGDVNEGGVGAGDGAAVDTGAGGATSDGRGATNTSGDLAADTNDDGCRAVGTGGESRDGAWWLITLGLLWQRRRQARRSNSQRT
jgi:MYXO-CTERM domain-containing protein